MSEEFITASGKIYRDLLNYFNDKIISNGQLSLKYTGEHPNAKTDNFNQCRVEARFALTSYTQGNIIDEIAHKIIDRGLEGLDKKEAVHNLISFTNELHLNAKDQEGKALYPKSLVEIQAKYPAKAEKSNEVA